MQVKDILEKITLKNLT